ncbi:signal peptidase II [Henriciella aquimarina]|uniref:signal peptidase II n=1 Tax=Henriciella aquimarina TaxID=545261 RepID=UPI0009FF3C05|nr:signal peptidase II [Henriciella aquimarina]
MAGPGNRYAWLAMIAGVIIADQLTKLWILATPAFNARDCLDITIACGSIEISSVFDLSMLWNRGISFGTLQSDGLMRWVLVLATGGIAAAFVYWLWRAERWLTALSLALVIGGALGNLIDRVRFGAVVDFLDFSGPWFGAYIAGWPVGFPWVFNIADASITVGAVLLFLDQFLMSRSGSEDATRA